MNWILDAALVCVFFAVVLIYIFRGFVKSIWGLAKIILSLMLAYFLGGMTSIWLYSGFVLNGISKVTYNTLEPMVREVQGKFDISELFSRLPAGFIDLVEGCGADIEKLSEEYSGIGTVTEDELRVLSDKISQPVAQTISNVAGYVIVFVASILILTILGVVIEKIADMDGLSSVNRFLGGVLGAAAGFAYVWVLCLIISIFVEKQLAGASGDSFRSIAENSILFRFFCDISPFDFINVKSLFNG